MFLLQGARAFSFALCRACLAASQELHDLLTVCLSAN
jgi:hypothetical protein